MKIAIAMLLLTAQADTSTMTKEEFLKWDAAEQAKITPKQHEAMRRARLICDEIQKWEDT